MMKVVRYKRERGKKNWTKEISSEQIVVSDNADITPGDESEENRKVRKQDGNTPTLPFSLWLFTLQREGAGTDQGGDEKIPQRRRFWHQRGHGSGDAARQSGAEKLWK